MTSKSEHPVGISAGFGATAGPMEKLPASFGIGLHPCRDTIVLEWTVAPNPSTRSAAEKLRILSDVLGGRVLMGCGRSRMQRRRDVVPVWTLISI
jgi:hypothetical protein